MATDIDPESQASTTGTTKAARRVAVIGVHGVAHHDPGETANAMADLLLSLPPFNPEKADSGCAQRPPKQFDHFDSAGLQIPLQPVCLKKRVDPDPNPSFPRAFRLQEGSYKFARYLAKKKGPGQRRGAVGREWSVKLLQDYYGAADSNKYVTERLEGQRADSTQVHIYEMFWADLARPTNNGLSFLLALFQFILHVPSLSRLAIESRPNPDWLWRMFQALHRYASRILQMALPLAKLVLLIVIAAAIPAVTTVQHLDVISAVVAGLILAIAGFLVMKLLLKPVFKLRTGWFTASFLAPALLTMGLVYYFKNCMDNSLEIVILAAAIWVLAAGLVWWALSAYEDTRPGIWGWGWMIYGISLGGFAIASLGARRHDEAASYWIKQASFWTLQWMLVFLRLSWILLSILAILSAVAGAIAWRVARSESEKSKARAAVRTSRFALAMPAFLFVFVTSLIWAALFSVAHRISNPDPFFNLSQVKEAWKTDASWYSDFDLLPRGSVADGFPDDCEARTPTCSGPKQECPSCAGNTKPEYLRGVLAWSVGYGSYLVVLITLAGLVVLVWWALPSVLTENFPPRRCLDWYVRHHTEPPRSSTNRDSMWMGGWISRGIDSISLVTWLTWCAIFLVPLAFLYSGPPRFLDVFREYSQSVTKGVICRVIAVASVTAILAALVHYSSPVLRVILDVDTYLRTGPIEGTPRAKIFERYVSLLRYIANFKGADGRGYDGIVIVAHSLGALISGDLLNLLRDQKNDPGLEKLGFGPNEGVTTIPVRLFTMGNPLRQLLNRFFPYLYEWVRDDPDNGSKPLGPPLDQAPADIDALLPDPADLGVEKWVSAYRSGDYVGRSLWLDEWYRRTDDSGELINQEPIKKIHDKEGSREEFCLGAGAHTHYWDDTAPDIATALDDLISA